LDVSEVQEVDYVVSAVGSKFTSVEDPDFVRCCPIYAHELPQRLRLELNAFRQEELGGALSICGYVVNDDTIGPTPEHWKTGTARSSVLPMEIYFMLCSALLGDAVGWATQQGGRIMHDIFPIEGHKKEQLGSGSEELLTWHTEDAFHPLRADYIGLACLRNPDHVATTLASVDDIQISDSIRNRLQQARYPIKPDRSHLPANSGEDGLLTDREKDLLDRSYEWVMALDRSPERVAVLFGDSRSPYLRIDPFFMEDPYCNEESAMAMEMISQEIDRSIKEHALEAGEILFLDNYKMVHGRVPFKASFDGTDRWLKRLNVVRDLRKSRDRRLSSDTRVIY
jgi:Fe(II)/alpha-ketoglutarate-dependent arginine beta-hydroxylase